MERGILAWASRESKQREDERVGLSEQMEPIAEIETFQEVARDATPQGRAATRTMRVLSYNILVGGWPRIDALEAVMRDARADIIGMQEVSPRTLDELARRLGMWSALGPSRRGSAVGLLSRWPLREVIPHESAPMHNALLEAVIAPDDEEPLRIFVAHLAASYSAWRAGEGERLRELAYILDRMRATGGPSAPQLLMGDFNSLPPDERLLASRLLLYTARNDALRAKGEDMVGQPGVRKVLPPPLRPLATALIGLAQAPALAWACDLAASAYVPRAVVRQTRAAGYTDLYTVSHPDPRGRELSCPSLSPAGRIDYIFTSDALSSRLATCELLADTPTCPVSRASDHRPMLATLAWGDGPAPA